MYAILYNPMIHNLLVKNGYDLDEDFAAYYDLDEEEKSWMKNHHEYTHRVSRDEDYPSYSTEYIKIYYTEDGHVDEISFSFGRYLRQYKDFSYKHFLGTREQFDRAIFNTILYFFEHWNRVYHNAERFQLVA